MKVALVCIAKNEDRYIDEWIQYNKKLGFDSIYIYQNNWRCVCSDERITKIEFDGEQKQIDAYNHFIHHNKNNYDWAAFLDVDEFLVLKKHEKIQDLLSDYNNEVALGINWVLFGDNNILDYSNEFGVLHRFTMRQSGVNPHIKSIINLQKCGYMTVHNHIGDCVDLHRRNISNTPFNVNGSDDIAQINHYFCKTKPEFIEKCSRGRADHTSYRKIEEFDSHNTNEIEDLHAKKFLYSDD